MEALAALRMAPSTQLYVLIPTVSQHPSRDHFFLFQTPVLECRRLTWECAACAKNCGLGGADYAARGITTQKDVLSMKMTKQTSTNANGYSLQGSRLYLLKDNTTYQPFMLKNQEFTYDVDVSKLPCGINGNLYFVAMAANGGNNYTGNTAGAARGTGYCDAQCGRNPMFINGKVHLIVAIDASHTDLLRPILTTQRLSNPPWEHAALRLVLKRRRRPHTMKPDTPVSPSSYLPSSSSQSCLLPWVPTFLRGQR